MPLESIENIQPLIDFILSVLALIALLFFIGLMYKLYQVCVGAIEVFKFFVTYRTAIRELMIQMERFCRRYSNIADGSPDETSNEHE